MQALLWTAPGYERQVLLEQPATCLDPAAPGEAAIGEALFNAPGLLGGQAERAGLSCAGCHANGRRSAGFFLGGISSTPGTADISSGFFALVRANAVFDPKPIPDLALPGKVPRDAHSGKLEPFLRGLVVEEFSGAEPSSAALVALGAYVRAVRACPGAEIAPKDAANDLRLLDRSIAGAAASLARDDRQSARVLIKAARFRLGLIHQRMAGAGLGPLRRRLLASSRELAPLETGADAPSLAAWSARFARETAPLVMRDEKRSLYNPRQVDRWLARRR